MKHTISGQRREDRTRRTVIWGASAAILPITAPLATLGLGWELPSVITATMVSTFVAAAMVAVLLYRVTRRMAVEQQQFDNERRHWREEAHTDPLCQIANRRGAYEAIELFKAGADDSSRWSVLAVDIDRFKEVNDRHGHAVGDRVLTSVADTLTAELPDGAAVARWGGDEFVVFSLSEQPLAESWVDRITSAVQARRVPCREGDLHVAVSVGLAEGPASSDFEDVLAVADDALLRAKGELRTPIELQEHEHTIALDTRTLDGRRLGLSRRAGEARAAGAWSS